MCYNIWLDTILQSSQICLLCLIITGLLPLGAALGPLLSSSASLLALLCVLPLSVCICWATTRPLQETWVVKNSHLPTTPISQGKYPSFRRPDSATLFYKLLLSCPWVPLTPLSTCPVWPSQPHSDLACRDPCGTVPTTEWSQKPSGTVLNV